MRFEPMTPREALLEIRRVLAGGVVGSGTLDRIAQAGLTASQTDFQLTDQLADRLAEAHKVLREIKEDAEHRALSREEVAPGVSLTEIARCLALAPDLESMVERRIGGD